jgi:hypothetical protein
MGTTFGPEITEYNYLWIYPTGDYVKPEVFVRLPGVRSATYNLYCVFLPSAGFTWTTPNPNILNFQLNYCGTNGKTATYNFSSTYIETGATADENPKTLNMNTAFVNNPEKTDTVFIGQFTFPVAYEGLGDDYTPNLHISCPISVFNKTQMSSYNRDLNIAGIILKPVELVEFEEKQKGK